MFSLHRQIACRGFPLAFSSMVLPSLALSQCCAFAAALGRRHDELQTLSGKEEKGDRLDFLTDVLVDPTPS